MRERKPLAPSTRYRTTKVSGRHVAVHRLTMETHLGRRLGTREHVHHINGDKEDNRLDNLELLTDVEHGLEHHPPRHPVTKRCQACGAEFRPHKTKRARQKTCGGRECRLYAIGANQVKKRKLTDEAVRAIRARRDSGEPLASLASEFAVSMSLVSAVALRRSHSRTPTIALAVTRAGEEGR